MRGRTAVLTAVLAGFALWRARRNAPELDQGARMRSRPDKGSAFRQAVPGGAAALPARVQSRQPRSADQVQRRIHRLKKRDPGPGHQVSIARWRRGRGQTTSTLINALASWSPMPSCRASTRPSPPRPRVLRVEEDYYQNWLVADSRRRRPDRPLGIARVNAKAPGPWTKGAGVKVAVVDTGIDYDHPDLKVAGGFNVITHNDQFKDDQGTARTFRHDSPRQDNGTGVVGVAPEVTLLRREGARRQRQRHLRGRHRGQSSGPRTTRWTSRTSA